MKTIMDMGLIELSNAIEFYDRVLNSTGDERTAVGNDHHEWLVQAARSLSKEYNRLPPFIDNVARNEDMSPRGYLRLLLDNDGDVIVAVAQDDGNGFIESVSSVEFCTIGMGGGGSQRTYRALRELMIAMDEDNKDLNSQGRAVKEDSE